MTDVLWLYYDDGPLYRVVTENSSGSITIGHIDTSLSTLPSISRDRVTRIHFRRNNSLDFSLEDDLFSNSSGFINLNTLSEEIPEEIPSLNTHGVTAFGYRCFTECPIGQLSIPSTVTSIGPNCFEFCTNILNVSNYGAITSLPTDCFSNCTSLNNVIIPDTINQIGANCFFGCTSLNSITLNSNITSVGLGCFGNCGFTDINFLTGFTSISDGCFLGNNNLTSVSMPNVTTIGNNAFYSCPNLNNISIPTVTTIGDYAFTDCTSLNAVTFANAKTVTIGTGIMNGVPTTGTMTLHGATGPSDLDPSMQTLVTYLTDFNNTDYQWNILYDALPCFKEGTQILTLINNTETYVPIENLKRCDLVCTLNSGYKSIDLIGRGKIYNPSSDERIKNRLYICKTDNYPELFEDLIITGCHSILVDDLTAEQREKTKELLQYIFVTDKKYRLMACVDERSEPYKIEGEHTIYHIALKNDDYCGNYGVYANGLLVETTSKRWLKELATMDLL